MRSVRPALPGVISTILVIIIGIEGVLLAADLGVFGSPIWRLVAFQFGAFWPGLLGEWQPHFRGQPVTMFITYTFLHGGVGHLLGNAVSLWSFGPVICHRTGQRGFVVIFILTSLGGAICYAALSAENTPMVGASGAIFGLAGVWLRWQWRERSGKIRDNLPIIAIIGLLIGLNVALYVWYDGALAWQTHLGGYMVGWICGEIRVRPKLQR